MFYLIQTQTITGDIVADAAFSFTRLCYKYASHRVKGEDYDKMFSEARAEYLKDTLPKLLKPLETFLRENNRKFLGGNTPCYADFQLWQFLDSNLNLDETNLNDYPKLKACEENFQSIPSIEKFLKEHPAGNYPMNNKSSCFGHSSEHNSRDKRTKSTK